VLTGEGLSRRAAEQIAAQAMLTQLQSSSSKHVPAPAKPTVVVKKAKVLAPSKTTPSDKKRG
jgi:ribonuclease-3